MEGDDESYRFIEEILLKVAALDMGAFVRQRGEKILRRAVGGELIWKEQDRSVKSESNRTRDPR